MHKLTRSVLVVQLSLLIFATVAQAQLKQFPTISRTHVAFIYANDLWIAPRNGGVATPLTNAPGMKGNALFSPDGGTLAFTANLEGNLEIYTVAIDGGTPFRVTHLPSGKGLSQWTADNKLLFHTNSLSFNNLAMQLFTVSPTGGLPARVNVPYGGEAAISSDGQWLAYTLNWPVSLMEHWKHYRGGMAHDIWLFNLRTNQSRQITKWEGTDTMPMWHGHSLYYVSDAGPENRLNIWEYNSRTGVRRQVTRFAEYDVRNPTIGPGEQAQGEIIFQYGPDLYLLDLLTGKPRVFEVTIPAADRELKPATVDASKFVTSSSLSPSGDKVLLNARGDIWVTAVPNGSPRNLTATSGVFERDPAWSPDGKWIAYFSDATGEYELYIRKPDDTAAPQQLTRLGAGFRFRPTWAPDSGAIVFLDQSNAIFLHTISTGETRRIDADEWGSQPQLSWSPDSSWLVYNTMGANGQRSIWSYSIASRTTHQITSGMFDDNQARFDPRGNYLFFISTRNYSSPTLSFSNRHFIYSNEDTIVTIPLRKDVPSPLSGSTVNSNASRIAMDFDGIEQRSVKLPVDAWGLDALDISADGNPVFIQTKLNAPRSLKMFDLKTLKERNIAEGLTSFSVSHGGKRALINTAGVLSVSDLSSDPSSPSPVSLAGMNVEVDRRAEWRQIFTDLWRLYRDFFYDPNMHRIDWSSMRRRYSKMVDACTTREDLNFVLSELAGELSVGHAYGGGGDLEPTPRVAIGMLGADFELQNGAYRISRIYEGAPWDTNGRGPLGQPALNVKRGDYLLAVNNKPVDVSKDPWAAFVGLAGTDTTITVSSKPVIDAAARQVIVKPVAGDNSFRYLAWIEANRSYVTKRTNGRVGYVHLPDFATGGLNSLVTQLYGQIDKDALIIDLRWSQGGSLGDVFVKMLDPRVFNYLGGRFSQDRPVPQRVHRGPKCLLVSGMSVSAGENFSYYFRKAGLGKIIGNRTWGGLVGLNGNPALIDGGYFNVPNAPFFEDDSTWLIEGHGIEPDIEVIDDPLKLVAGIEPQLDAAIEQMMNELRLKPFRKARKPTTSRDRRRGIVHPSEK